MTYIPIDFKNLPNTTTPLSAANMNHIQEQFSEAEALISSTVAPLNSRVSGVEAQVVDLEGDLAPIPAEISSISADLATLTTTVDSLGGVTPFVEGVKLYSYGHSYTYAPNAWSTPNGGEYGYRVGGRIRASETFCRGRSGTPAIDTLCLAMSSSWDTQTTLNRQWTPGSKGLVLLQNYMNEMPMADGVQPLFRDMWIRSIRSLIGLFSSDKITTVSSLTRRGAWTSYGNSTNKIMFVGEDCMFANTIGAEIDASVTGDEAWVITTTSDNTYSLGEIEVLCGGSVVLTENLNARNWPYTSTVRPGEVRSMYPTWLRVSGLNAASGTSGQKTITIRVKTAGTVFINGVAQPSATPPHVFLGKEPLRSPLATSGNANYLINRPVYDAMAEQVAGEFPNVTLVDLDVGWDVDTMVSSIDPGKHHPNDLGMWSLANQFTAAINETISSPVNGVWKL